VLLIIIPRSTINLIELLYTYVPYICIFHIYAKCLRACINVISIFNVFFFWAYIYIHIPSQYDFRFAYIVPTSFPVIMTKFTLSSLSFLVWAHILQSKRKLPALPNR